MSINNNILVSPPVQSCSPTNTQRYIMAKYALLERGRPEDINNVFQLMSPPASITSIAAPGQCKNIKVAIIGAGLAGLSAAFELRRAGFDITIFEAEEGRVGGRVYTYYFDKNKELYGELGAMRIPVTHETAWHYINLFRLETRPFVQNNPNAFIYLRDTRVRNDPLGRNVMEYIYPKYFLNERERNTPWQKLYYYALESPLLCASPEERRELLEVKPFYNKYIVYWDFQGIRKIMEAAGLTNAAISMLSSLSPLAGSNLYNSYVDIAQANYPANLSFLYEIPGGTSRLADAFRDSLTDVNPAGHYPGADIAGLGKVIWKMGSPVTGIYYEGEKVRLSYLDRKTGNTPQCRFDYVVCAIPFSALRNVQIEPVFSGLKMQAIKEVNYIDSMKCIMLCRRRFWEEGGADRRIIGGGSYTDLPVQTIWYPSGSSSCCYNNYSSAEKPGVLLASYNYNLDSVRLGNLPESLRFSEIKHEVERVNGLPGGYLDNIVIESKTIDWSRNPWTRGALCFFSPQQKRIFSYAMTLPEYNRRVYFAGDHISAVHRWIQGALQSGMKAANDIACACRESIPYKH